MRKLIVVIAALAIMMVSALPAQARHPGGNHGEPSNEGLSACAEMLIHPNTVDHPNGPVIAFGGASDWDFEGEGGCRVLDPEPVGNGPDGEGPPGNLPDE